MGKNSFHDAHELTRAANAQGATSGSIEAVLNLGAKGKWVSNLERDYHRLAGKILGIPDIIYKAKVTCKSTATGRPALVQIGFLLPHELFGILRERDRDLFHKVTGASNREKYWVHMFHVNEQWLQEHPLRERIQETPNRACGYRFFGDDTGLNKGSDRPCSISLVHYEGCELPTWYSKLPTLVLPKHHEIDQVTMCECEEIIAWSLNILATGKWPSHRHDGTPFAAKSWRGKRATTWLTAERHFGVYLGTLADWSWNVSHYRFPQYYGKPDICQVCTASKLPDDTIFSHFQPCPCRPHAGYMASLGASLSPLTKIIGWHLTTVLPESMHGGPLGCCPIVNGTCLLELCNLGFLGDAGGPGPWAMRLGIQLSYAFEDLLTWSAQERKPHSQKRFTVAKLTLTSLQSFPVLKGKAHNQLVVQEWLATKTAEYNDSLRSQGLAVSDYSKLRACIAWAWHSFFWVLRNAGSELDDSEVRKIEECGLFMFHGWNEAAALAIANNEPRWQMIPKLHMMWHCWRHAVQTRRNPTKQWAFMDEDAMQKISRVAMKCHGSAVPERSVQRWLMHFFGA